jgi:hypothetical protein
MARHRCRIAVAGAQLAHGRGSRVSRTLLRVYSHSVLGQVDARSVCRRQGREWKYLCAGQPGHEVRWNGVRLVHTWAALMRRYLEAIRVLKGRGFTPRRTVHVLFVPGKLHKVLFT